MRRSEFPVHCACGYEGTIDELGNDVPLAELRKQQNPGYGPGTELKKMLAWLGITADAGCKCNDRARQMDLRGPDWCEQNLDTIVGWLREEAQKRPVLSRLWSDRAAMGIVRIAIRRARQHNERQSLGQ